jgi:hypothetical protein
MSIDLNIAAGVAIEPRRVRVEVNNLDLFPARVHLRRQVFELENIEQIVVEFELFAIHELADGRGGDDLADARQAEQRRWLHGQLLIRVGESETAGIKQSPILGDGDRHAGRALLGEELQRQLVHLGQCRNRRAGHRRLFRLRLRVGDAGARGYDQRDKNPTHRQISIAILERAIS